MRKTNSQLTGEFEWRIPSVVPAFVQGKDAKRIYGFVNKISANSVWYDAENKLMKGSNVPAVARIDTLVRPLGIRVATLRDLSSPDVMEMIRGDHYSDTPVFVFRSNIDTYEPNQPIIERVVQEVETREGKVEFPFMITGFDVSKAHSPYGWTIAPRDDFAIVHDERLDGKYNAKAFNEVDELGLPNFDKNGSRKWFARNQGVSGLYLGRSLDLGSSCEYLASSSEVGRVVLICGEAAGADLRAKYRTSQKANLQVLRQSLEAQHEQRSKRIDALAKEFGL
jgi:hypothetical protein